VEFFIARHPVFNRKRQVFAYKLQLCQGLRDLYYGQYREPEDAEQLYRRLCFSGLDEDQSKPMTILDFSEELIETVVSILPRKLVIVEYAGGGKSEHTELKEIRRIQTYGYKVLYDATINISRNVLQTVDGLKLDYSALNEQTQRERMADYSKKLVFFAGGVDTWDAYNRAHALGYDYFQGSFFLKPLTGRESVMRSLSAPALRIMSELGEPEPSFREITNIIEHDLNLSYSLLKLVNSAYIAPGFKVKTISQAVTILGIGEMSQFVTAILMKQLKSADNGELLRRSLFRGKYMDLLAASEKIPQKGSEAFFTGVFSLIDVILNKSMAEILEDLPLTDAVKGALLGRGGALKSLLDMVKLYESAQWKEFEAHYNLDITEQEQMMNLYLTALKWAESLDF